MTTVIHAHTKTENVRHYVQFVMLITRMRSAGQMSLVTTVYYNRLAFAEFRAKELDRLALKARIYLLSSREEK